MRQDAASGSRCAALPAVTIGAARSAVVLTHLLLAGSPLPAMAQQPAWDASGSTLTQGLKPPATITFTFQTPHGDFATQGALAGNVLLEVERDGQNLAGVAYAFRPGCAGESYEVSGSISADDKLLTLKGRAPVRDAACKVVSFRDQTLVISQRAAAPPVAQAPPRPRAAGEQCGLRPSSGGTERYCVSSVLPSQYGNSYDVHNLFAGGGGQAWVEGQAGQGIGEWIVVEFSVPRRIGGLAIDNGYQKNQDIYFKNSRVRTLEVAFSQGHRETISLDDRFGTQTISFATPTVASWIQLTIKDVYPGTKYTDTAISKLFVQSTAAN